MTVVIEKDVPRQRLWWHRYPFEEMEVGDSFLDPKMSAYPASAAAYKAGKALGRRFSRKKTREGYRIWRIQ